MRRFALLFAAIPLPAFAHAGDHSFATILHLLTEPDHLAMLALGVAVAVYATLKLRARR
jgi:uncharacterized membrane protein